MISSVCLSILRISDWAHLFSFTYPITMQHLRYQLPVLGEHRIGLKTFSMCEGYFQRKKDRRLLETVLYEKRVIFYERVNSTYRRSPEINGAWLKYPKADGAEMNGSRTLWQQTKIAFVVP